MSESDVNEAARWVVELDEEHARIAAGIRSELAKVDHILAPARAELAAIDEQRIVAHSQLRRKAEQLLADRVQSIRARLRAARNLDDQLEALNSQGVSGLIDQALQSSAKKVAEKPLPPQHPIENSAS